MMAKKLGNFTEMVDSKWMEQFISQVLLVLLTETPATISTKTTSPSQGGGGAGKKSKAPEYTSSQNDECTGLFRM